ncbi:xylose isomerase [Microvirga tunisiensis]|uniref:Xylose isomerase n=2 Tax=Pannonibacter tanglangensis TaxID=2750084 RepID=A0ABW9ZL32_9HYPH|nr:xylose isomerase [Pannonibacter sp. XCT-34]NBN79620.1 xylose isomerase [Pannonibacter sp. XCT-53]
MATGFFDGLEPVRYVGPDAREPYGYRYYDKDRVVLGKRMEDHLRLAICYWHSFCWPGGDPFGGDTFQRTWMAAGDPMQQAKLKADVAFEMFQLLDMPFFTFHDRDIAPEGATLAESNANVNAIADIFERKMADSGVRLLWGTANLFSNRRFMAGAATNPDPDVFAYAGAQVKHAMDVTHRLGGANYVLWGGREGYETLLNTDLKRELDQLGRFLTMVVEYKHRIGFKGTILIEPKPQEPTKHQYDFDVATVFGFLKAYGLENEVKVNIEQGHAILAGHSFEHELAMANALGIFGSVDMNRNDYQSGWDTDQFAMNVPEMALAYYEILKGGGFTTGGTNFDSKIRRQSIDAVDLIQAHVGSADAIARGLLAAAAMIEDGRLGGFVKDRYAGWSAPENAAILTGTVTLEALADRVHGASLEPQPKSGRQEYLESLVNLFV